MRLYDESTCEHLSSILFVPLHCSCDSAASIFTANYGDQRCGNGDLESVRRFSFSTRLRFDPSRLYFKMQDLH